MVYRQVRNTELEQQLGFPSMPCTSWVGPESNKWAVDGETDLVIALDTWSTLTSPDSQGWLDTIALTCREACAKSVCQTARKKTRAGRKRAVWWSLCVCLCMSVMETYTSISELLSIYFHGPWLVNHFIRAGQCFLMIRRAMSSIKGFSLFLYLATV